MKAILEGKTVRRTEDIFEWAKWFEKATKEKSRHVADDYFDRVRVSTVFLGLDHGLGGFPLWFETMIFGGPHDGFQKRASTWAEAEECHKEAVMLVQS